MALHAEQQREVDLARGQRAGERSDVAHLGGERHRVGPAGMVVRPPLLDDGQACRDERDDEQHREADDLDAQPPCDAAVPTYLLLLGCDRRVEELLLGGREPVGARPRPLERAVEPGAAVELGRVAPERIPLLRGGGEVLADALSLAVFVEPAPQPRPRACECLVRDLQGVRAGRQQARTQQCVDHVALRVVDDRGTREAVRAPARPRRRPRRAGAERRASLPAGRQAASRTVARPSGRPHRSRRRCRGSPRPSTRAPRDAPRSRRARARAAATPPARRRRRARAGRRAPARAGGRPGVPVLRWPRAAAARSSAPSRYRPSSTMRRKRGMRRGRPDVVGTQHDDDRAARRPRARSRRRTGSGPRRRCRP